MTWTLFTKSKLLYFQEDELRGKDRDAWNKFKDYTLRDTDNPRQFAYTQCPDSEHKVVLQIPNTDYLLLTYIYDENFKHPVHGECIMLVKLGPMNNFPKK